MNSEIEIEAKKSDGIKTAKKKPRAKKPTKLQQALLDVDELNDKMLRQAAEFENFKKRSVRESDNAINRTRDYTIASFLPLLDDIERTLSSVKEHKGIDSFVEGIELIKINFDKILSEKGVVPIESEGNQFDPELHEAMMVESNSDLENNIVIEEFERGFKHGDRVLRPSKVKVNRISDGE